MRIDAGKNVFVEKPLAVSVDQLRGVRKSLDASRGGLMVGFNRRFAPHAVAIKEFMKNSGPLTVQFRCNAGTIPAEHWLSDPAEGGRIIGEACHFFDLFNYWSGARPVRVFAAASRLYRRRRGDHDRLRRRFGLPTDIHNDWFARFWKGAGGSLRRRQGGGAGRFQATRLAANHRPRDQAKTAAPPTKGTRPN